MKKTFSVLIICAGFAYTHASAFPEGLSLVPKKIIFNEVVHTNNKGEVGPLYEKVIIGRFLRDEKVIVTKDSHLSVVSDPSPFNLLSQMLEVVSNKDFDRLESLYSPNTRSKVGERLEDPSVSNQIKAWLSSLSSFEFLGMWLKSPNLLVMYVKDNNDFVHPYVFEFVGQWFLWSGHLDSSLSSKLDGFYMRHANDEMEVLIPPPADAIIKLIEDVELVSFARMIGVNVDEF